MSAGNTRGIAAMSAAMALFVASDTFMKAASEGANPAQLLFVRGLLLVSVTFLLAWRLRALENVGGLLQSRTLVRTIAEGLGTFTYVVSLAYIPIATALAIHMATPLFVLPLSRWILGERIRLGQFFAILTGLAGVLLILRPTVEGFDIWLVVSLSSAVLFALRDTLTRTIPARVPSIVVLLGGVIAGTTAGAAGVAGSGWGPIGFVELGCVAAAAFFVGTGMQLMIIAMRSGEISVVSPFRYTAILWAVVSGYAIWGALPDGPTVAGIGLIVAAGLYSLLRDRFNARDRDRQASG
jgi:drug/metabolite transporter (DMT)-like permease